MKHLLTAAVMIGATLLPMAYLAAHCEVPCGIYDDDARFAAMKEDQATIAKAIAGIHEMASEPDVNDINQLARWVSTKEGRVAEGRAMEGRGVAVRGAPMTAARAAVAAAAAEALRAAATVAARAAATVGAARDRLVVGEAGVTVRAPQST